MDNDIALNEQIRHINEPESEEKQEQDSPPTKRTSSNDDAATVPATETTNVTFQTDCSSRRNDVLKDGELATEPQDEEAT